MLEKKITRSYQLKQKNIRQNSIPIYDLKNTLRKLRIKENFLNLIKTSTKKPS